jgi:periplasmic divalent cation tolerance protein
MTSDYKIVLTTCETKSDARALGALLVEKKLAACVNILPEVESVYVWQGKVEQQTESKLFIKTNVQRLDELMLCIKQHHTYDVPEIQVIDVSAGNPDYFNWINEVLS